MPRRTFLRSGALGIGAGVTVGLPLLDAMLDESRTANAQSQLNPRRFITWFFGSGFNGDLIEPRVASGLPISTSDPAAPHLAPFGGVAGLENDMTFCSGLALPPGGVADNHHFGRTGRFSGYANVGGGLTSDWGGPTIDQEVADLIAVNSPTAIHSLQLRVSKHGDTAATDSGTAATALSARLVGGSLIALPPEHNPQIVFNALFSGQNVPEHKKSILDFISTDLTRLQTALGQSDRARVEAHLDAIRQLESSIAAGSLCVAPAAPTEDNSQTYSSERISEVNAAMASLVALAFECDLTRVVSVEFTRIAGDPEFWQSPGWPNGARQHSESHSANQTNYDAGVLFAMEHLAQWFERLRGTARNGSTIGTSNLLDHTIVYASSDVGWGQNHTQRRTPIILGGRGKEGDTFYLKSGQHYVSPGSELTLPTHVRLDKNDAFSTDMPVGGSSSEIQLTCLRAFDPAAASGNTTFGDVDLGFTGSGVAALLET